MCFFCLHYDGLWCINKDFLSPNRSGDLGSIGTLMPHDHDHLITKVSYCLDGEVDCRGQSISM